MPNTLKTPLLAIALLTALPTMLLADGDWDKVMTWAGIILLCLVLTWIGSIIVLLRVRKTGSLGARVIGNILGLINFLPLFPLYAIFDPFTVLLVTGIPLAYIIAINLIKPIGESHTVTEPDAENADEF